MKRNSFCFRKIYPIFSLLLYFTEGQNLTTRIGSGEGLTYVGQSGTKTFYANDIKQTWSQARQFCRNEGMLIASITTPGELLELQTSKNIRKRTGYWVGASASLDLGCFTWDQQKLTRPTGVPFGTVGKVETLYCLAYGDRDNERFLYIRSCTYELRVICEMEATVGKNN